MSRLRVIIGGTALALLAAAVPIAVMAYATWDRAVSVEQEDVGSGSLVLWDVDTGHRQKAQRVARAHDAGPELVVEAHLAALYHVREVHVPDPLGLLALELGERDVVGGHETERASGEQMRNDRPAADVTRARIRSAQQLVEQEQHRRLGRRVLHHAA